MNGSRSSPTTPNLRATSRAAFSVVPSASMNVVAWLVSASVSLAAIHT